jgi:hypothetical protein
MNYHRKMDFQSAMETFAEAWVAANTGKLGTGLTAANVVSSLAAAGTNLDLNKAAESIIQQQLVWLKFHVSMLYL